MQDPNDPSSSPPLEKGLAAAFGQREADPEMPASSVLRILQARSPSVGGLHLDGDADDAPVKVTEEAKRLRNPSGRYQVLGEIGRGGVGVVYKGRDQDLGRDIAMKVLKDEYASHAEVLARFVEEAQIGGQLQHPGIVPVYELGLQAGERPYFAMKLVKGETLAAQLARRGDPVADRRRLLGVFEQMCQTMAYAHSRRVVHRDLKPANVMIGAFGEVQVVDWGFAKVLPKGGVADEREASRASERTNRERSSIETVRSREGSGSHSIVGSVLGTPAYMPPEQALGDIERLDQRTDVFALGAILCEILTGAPPYRPQDGDVVQMAANGKLDGAHERLRQSGADQELVELCIECLSRAQGARPASSVELAARIGGYLTSVEERARRAEVRAAEARLRHRTTIWASAAAFAVLATGAVTWLRLDAAGRERAAEAEQRVASAMNTVSGARGEAHVAGLDLHLWATAAAEADHLETLLTSDDVGDAARQRAEALIARVRREGEAAQRESARLARDAAMLARLSTLRIPTDENVRVSGWRRRDRERLDAGYAAAFRDYLDGRDLPSTPAADVLASLRHGEIETELATTLDHWALIRDALRKDGEPDANAPGTARIRELAARLDPADPWRTHLRQLLVDVQREGKNLRELAARVDDTTLGPSGYRLLGEALWRAHEHEAALAVLARGQQAHPSDFDLCFQLALLQQIVTPPQWQQAVDTYRIARALDPGHGEVLHRQGMALDQLNRHADAERVFRLLSSREPANTHWLRHVADSVAAQGRYDESISVLRAALHHDPNDVIAAARLAGLLMERDGLAEAESLLERASGIAPNDGSVLAQLGLVRGRQGRVDEAERLLQRAVAIDPSNMEARLNLGVALSAAGRLDEALSHHQHAAVADPDDPLAQLYVGMTLARLGRYEEAVEPLSRAAEIDATLVASHVWLGASLLHLQRHDDAVTPLRLALQLAPDDALNHSQLGTALAGRGDLHDALVELQAAERLLIARTDEEARSQLAQCRRTIEQVRQDLAREAGDAK